MMATSKWHYTRANNRRGQCEGGIDFNNNTGFVNDPRVIDLSVRFAH